MVTKLGRSGQKAGKGWYDYDQAIGQGRKGFDSKEMSDFIQEFYQPSAPISLPEMTDEEIVERVLFPLVNEGFKCLEEGIAHQPSDIDVIYLYGYGFPAWRGGPMFWADNEIGLPRLLQRLREFAAHFPGTEHFVPSALLETCVQRGTTLEEHFRLRSNSSASGRSKL